MSDAVRTVLRGLGQTLITLGVVVLLFCVYELKVTGLVTAREQDRLGDDLRASWADPAPRPMGAAPVPVSSDLGEGIAVLHVPALADYDPWVVVEGTSVADLKAGPGHIPGTAMPGEVGNVVLSRPPHDLRRAVRALRRPAAGRSGGARDPRPAGSPTRSPGRRSSRRPRSR